MRISILLTFIFGCVISLNAQNKWSLHTTVGAGFYGLAKKEKTDLTRYGYQTTEKYIAKPGVNTGLELAYTLNPKWRFSTGINYQFFQLKKENTYEHFDELGTIYRERTYEKEHTDQALQLPLQCSYVVWNKKNKLSIDAGLITSYLLGSNFYYFEENLSPSEPIDILFPHKALDEHRLDFLLSGGLIFQPFKQLAFRLSYEYDIADYRLKSQLFEGNAIWQIEEYDLHISSLEFGVVYQLVKKKRRSL